MKTLSSVQHDDFFDHFDNSELDASVIDRQSMIAADPDPVDSEEDRMDDFAEDQKVQQLRAKRQGVRKMRHYHY